MNTRGKAAQAVLISLVVFGACGTVVFFQGRDTADDAEVAWRATVDEWLERRILLLSDAELDAMRVHESGLPAGGGRRGTESGRRNKRPQAQPGPPCAAAGLTPWGSLHDPGA